MTKPQILFIPSYSMRSYTKGTWLLSRDAHATQFNAMAHWLRNDYRITVHVPAKGDHIENNLFTGCELISDVNYGKNIAEQRTRLDWMSIFNARKDDYEFILTGHPEYAHRLRELFPKAKIASILTHGPLIDYRYIESLKADLDASDIIFYNFARILFPSRIEKEYFTKLQPLYNYADWDIFRIGEGPHRGQIPKSILFPCRLSDDTRFDVEHWTWLLKNFAAHGYTVWLTDPSEIMGSLTKSELAQSGLIFRDQPNRAAWFELLQEAETVIIPYSIERTISVTAFEALGVGAKLIMPRCECHFRHLNSEYSIDPMPTSEHLKMALDVPYDGQPRIYAQKYFIDQTWCRRFKETYIKQYASTNA